MRLKEASTKRINVNIDTKLHHAFKSATAAQGTDMTSVLMEFIERYVAKHRAVKGDGPDR